MMDVNDFQFYNNQYTMYASQLIRKKMSQEWLCIGPTGPVGPIGSIGPVEGGRYHRAFMVTI